MTKRIGVLAIHGIGSQGATPKPTDQLDYSRDLFDLVSFERDYDMRAVAWREVLWSHILQSKQDAYLDAIKPFTNTWGIREFVMRNLSDAGSYCLPPGFDVATTLDAKPSPEDAYSRIHREVDDALGDMANDIGPDAPLIIVAHSLGCHITSNFIYDLQAYAAKHGAKLRDTPLRNMETVASIITMGCNIPVFMFAIPDQDITPIAYPGAALPKAMRFPRWWYNFHDPDDVLGFPMRFSGNAYRAMSETGILKDEPVEAGGLFSFWNPRSHVGYWRTKSVARRVAFQIRALEEAVP